MDNIFLKSVDLFCSSRANIILQGDVERKVSVQKYTIYIIK